MIYSLYVKEHNKTHLKYLGYTSKNPYLYKGSGLKWINHINKHGNDVSTYVIATFDLLSKLRIVGSEYSKAWNIVESNEWANLKEESGDGGSYPHNDKTKQLLREMNKGNLNPNWGCHRKHSAETKEKIRQKALCQLRNGFSALARQKTIQTLKERGMPEKAKRIISFKNKGFVSVYDVVDKKYTRLTSEQFYKQKEKRYVGVNKKGIKNA